MSYLSVLTCSCMKPSIIWNENAVVSFFYSSIAAICIGFCFFTMKSNWAEKKSVCDSVKNEIQIHQVYVCIFFCANDTCTTFLHSYGMPAFVYFLQQILNLPSSQMRMSIFLFLHRPNRPCNLDSKCIHFRFCFVFCFEWENKCIFRSPTLAHSIPFNENRIWKMRNE